MASDIRLLVGLGNPGRRFDNTPHNIGFEVLDELASRHALRFRRCFRLPGRAALWQKEPSPLRLLKPRTFMNRSGEAVAKAIRLWGFAPEQVLVVYDDLELPLGRMRLRKKGSAGGHNGLSSVIQSLGGSQDFPRLRLGVGPRPAGDELVSYVLSPWKAEAADDVAALRKRGADALDRALRDGLDAAMNFFNAG